MVTPGRKPHGPLLSENAAGPLLRLGLLVFLSIPSAFSAFSLARYPARANDRLWQAGSPKIHSSWLAGNPLLPSTSPKIQAPWRRPCRNCRPRESAAASDDRTGQDAMHALPPRELSEPGAASHVHPTAPMLGRQRPWCPPLHDTSPTCPPLHLGNH